MLKIKYICNFAIDSIKYIKTANVSPSGRYIRNLSALSSDSIKKNRVTSIDDLTQYITRDKPVYLKLVTNIFKSINFENVSNEEALLLLNCCGVSIIDSSTEARNNVCQQIYESLAKHNKLNINIYHKYIETCIENGMKLNSNEFLSKLKCEPTRDTYHLLLRNVCEKGDIEQAYRLLEIMKEKSISVAEDTFNYLILAYTIEGGFQGADSVLVTMRTAHIPETFQTLFAVLKGILRRNNYDEFKIFLQKYPIKLDQIHLMDVLKDVGLNGNESWLSEMKSLYGNIDVSKEFVMLLKDVCTHLVYMNRSETSMALFEHFVPPSYEDDYGFFIVKNMLHWNVEIDRILKVATHLRDDGLNSHVFEDLAEIALKRNYVEVAWKLLENLAELKPHYFWPLLIHAHKSTGEADVLKTIKEINRLNVKLDAESLELYVIPFCNLQDPKLLIQKLKELGFTVKELLNPTISVLLKNRQVKDAAFLCKFYNVEVSGDNLVKQLTSSWYNTRDAESIVTILQKYCEHGNSMHEIVSDFLIKTLVYCKDAEDFTSYLSLLKVINDRSLKLSLPSISIIQNMVSSNCSNDADKEKILQSVDALLDFGLKTEVAPHIPHPRDMKTDELECHLLELQGKNMKTRGILRKLIQQYSRLGDFKKVQQLREHFLSEGYQETVGMKSNLMHTYIICSKLEPALAMYREIKDLDPKFTMDEFKILDLASLLVKENRTDEARQIMETESKMKKVLGGSAVERNCWELLRSFKNEKEQIVTFDFLMDKGYCKATNVILGPLVRIHLNSGDIEKAANTYINLIDKYKRTPLQLEVLREVVKLQDAALLQTVLDKTTLVHGNISTQVVLIAALSENGNKKVLDKVLANNNLPIRKHLEIRCKRWVEEGKVEPLRILVEACKRLSQDIIDVDFLFECVIKIYDNNNDCESALKFHRYLLENEYLVKKKLEEQIDLMLNRNNFKKVGETCQ